MLHRLFGSKAIHSWYTGNSVPHYVDPLNNTGRIAANSEKKERTMRIKLEYIEVQMLLSGLEAIHLPNVAHHEIMKKLHRRLERMESDYTSGYADNPVNAKIEKAVDKVDS